MYKRELLSYGSLCQVEKLFGHRDQKLLKVRKIGITKFYLEGHYHAFDLETGVGKAPANRGGRECYKVNKIFNPIQVKELKILNPIRNGKKERED